MRYFNELKDQCIIWQKTKKTIFLGQAVEVPSTAMSNTLKGINKKKLLELPVAEEMQMGITIGMIMTGLIPISIYPRWNFLLLSINQLVNHLDKFNEMTQNYYKSKAIIRTSIGSQRPLNPQSQHMGDFSAPIKKMAKNIEIVKLKDPKDIFPSYKKALTRNDNVSTILVEYGDYYNEK